MATHDELERHAGRVRDLGRGESFDVPYADHPDPHA